VEANLRDILIHKKDIILKRWFDAILDSYLPETSDHLKVDSNPFTNPVGYNISEGIEGIFNGIIVEGKTESLSPFLDQVIRIRAVQDFTPSQAVAFVFLLKNVIREELKNEIRKGMLYEELLHVESKIDDIAIRCFDLFMKCREKIYELKANELRNMTFMLLQRANQIHEMER